MTKNVNGSSKRRNRQRTTQAHKLLKEEGRVLRDAKLKSRLKDPSVHKGRWSAEDVDFEGNEHLWPDHKDWIKYKKFALAPGKLTNKTMTRMIPQYAAWLVPVARLREFNNTPNASRIAIFQEVRFEIVEEISRHKKFRLLGQVVPTIAELLPVNTFLHVDNKERPAEIQCLSTMRKWFRRQILRSILRDRAVLCAAIMLQEQPQGIAAAADNLNSRLLEDLEVTDGDSVQILARATSTFCHANPGLRLKSLYYPECLFLENGVRVNAADVRVEANYSRMASKLITRLHPGFPVTWPTSPLRNHHCDECGQTLTWIELLYHYEVASTSTSQYTRRRHEENVYCVN